MSAPTDRAPLDHAPVDRDRLAAEHVLGLLTGDEAAAAERLEAEDAAFATAVEDWRVRFFELDGTAPGLDPGTELWSRIAARLETPSTGAPDPARATPDPARAAPDPAPLPPLPPARARPAPPRAAPSVRVWKTAAGLATAAAVALAVALGLLARDLGRQPVLVAVLLSDAGRPAAVVNSFAGGRTELLPLSDVAVPEGKVLEVWTLWDRARGPVSVGLLDRLRSADLGVDGLPLGADQLFEITVEPAGGSPTGRPTGPVLMKGTAAQAL